MEQQKNKRKKAESGNNNMENRKNLFRNNNEIIGRTPQFTYFRIKFSFYLHCLHLLATT